MKNRRANDAQTDIARLAWPGDDEDWRSEAYRTWTTTSRPAASELDGSGRPYGFVDSESIGQTGAIGVE